MQTTYLQNKPNFKGSFYGVLKSTSGTHKYPSSPVNTCPYADRLMLKTITKIMRSEKFAQNLKVTFSKSNDTKKLIFDLDPKTTKKTLPKILQILQGNFLNLTDPTFWKILNNKKTEKIRYEFDKNHLEKLVEYFYCPKLPSQILSNKKLDSKILQKINLFETSLRNTYSNFENEKWLNEFFQQK